MLNRRTRNLFLALILMIVGNCVFAQNRGQGIVAKPTAQSMKAGAFIDVNAAGYPESNFSITQLVKDVLISGGSACSAANVTNVVVSPNLPTSNPDRSWGYFNKATTNFPFAKGIVLTTGFARKAGNNFQATLSDGLSVQGDTDLATALGISNADLRDASYIEFDFVPASTKVTFRYLFASKEYQQDYPCTIGDGFALLLKKVGDPTYQNLAVLPGGTPVSVTNIHPTISTPGGGGCPAVNESYFAGYNTANIETNFNGRVIPLTASATVIPGQTYHFKMVLADYSDSNFDSAVFLEAGSFDIGVQILNPAGVALPPSINVCDNAPQTFTASVQGGGATYQWLLGGNPIPGATNASYTATQPGVYSVQVFLPGNTCPGTATVTIVGGTSPTVQNATLTACYVQGNATFNLTSAQTSISTTPGATFAYYVNQADALAGNANTISNTTAFPSAGQTIYVLVKSGFCSKVAELQLVKAPQMTATIAPPSVLTCTNSQITLDATTSVYPAGATFNWTTTNGNIVSGANTLNPVINLAGTYTLTISNTYQPQNLTCTATANVTVTGDSAPPTTGLTASKLIICSGESVTLTASGGTTYNWVGLPGTGATQTVSPTATTTYTVTAVGANGCVSQNPATITITVNQPFTAQNATLFKCYQDGGINYDLTEAQPQITSATGVTFAYYVNLADANAGNANTIANPASFNSAGGQTIYVLVSNGGCKYVVTLQLSATPQTTLTIAPPQQITCTTAQTTLNASASVIPAGSTIAWTTTGGGNIVSGANTLNPLVNAGGVYTLTVSNVNQPGNLTCTYTANVTVTQNTTLPVATVTSSVPQICPGESVTLTASGGATYNWVGLPGNGNTQVVSPTVTTTYTVFAVGANGCISANPATVTIIVGPPVAVLAASKSKICVGESVTLTATGGVTYEWVGLPGNGNTQIVSPTADMIYCVYALGGNGCKVENPTCITIQVVPAIVSTLEDVYVCAGDFGTLDAGPGLNYTYVWNTGATTQTISVNTPGTYSVTISNGTCSKVFTAQLINPALPQFTNVTYENHILTLTATNPTGGTLEYSIDGGLTWQNSNIFYNVLDNTSYNLMVKVKDAKCSTTLEYFTFVISNAITPNSDGKNDTIDFTGISKYNNFAASIFDRYGQEVFKAGKTDTVWHGTIRGSLSLPTATYWYRVQWENPASKKLEMRGGWILLKNRN
ncbi:MULTISPECIES: choice-of-anchor L domain-containing protein [Chryseobacterium]|uniref:Gliding motility-associated-like protein n=1 Tax=Chryseobacterium geocarposphaerae TaxID=1416776 RepID=A0ABU1L9U7_9FLAO|nr:MULTISPECIES: choice-of-anchor L domain-containing protein [Chryseobacterium]MDR6403493.1 gliding motility-associated-like protein [Chryseobacterium geocarposphaerae]MDR6697047.1 gliding motility-associated-like protein [Chryseobacterium ginsenosidimutans]